MRFRLILALLSCALGVAYVVHAVGWQSAPPPEDRIGVVRTYADLKRQPPHDLGAGTQVRFGVGPGPFRRAGLAGRWLDVFVLESWARGQEGRPADFAVVKRTDRTLQVAPMTVERRWSSLTEPETGTRWSLVRHRMRLAEGDDALEVEAHRLAPGQPLFASFDEWVGSVRLASCTVETGADPEPWFALERVGEDLSTRIRLRPVLHEARTVQTDLAFEDLAVPARDDALLVEDPATRRVSADITLVATPAGFELQSPRPIPFRIRRGLVCRLRQAGPDELGGGPAEDAIHVLQADVVWDLARFRTGDRVAVDLLIGNGRRTNVSVFTVP